MSQTVNVGYSGSESSAEAVAWAATEAEVRAATLRIVTCVEMPVVSGEAALGWNSGAAYEAIREASLATSEGMATKVRAEHPQLTVTAEVIPGPAASALLTDTAPTDLIVVGASSHEGAAAFWLGTTPRQLVHNSPCPVAVIRGAATRGAPDRIVVGIDGSATSDAAVVWAADEADRHNVSLHLVHGWSYAYAPVDASATQARDLTEVDADCTLNRSIEFARERCGATVTGQLVESSAVTALLEFVQDGDLLVLGSHGHGGLRSRLLGSTVNSVLDSAAVPVVVVRPTKPA
ncbi:MAG: universal stress protein [Ilumatobacteraceae bacterium]|nr:universal stress protein [Ilumatobacteraceae bacterium]